MRPCRGGVVRDGGNSSSGMSPMGTERYSPASHASTQQLPEQLSDRFWERIRVFACRRLGDPALAEDVAQETLRRVIEALRAERVANLEALPAFVFQTARHICMQRARSERRERSAMERIGQREESTAPPDALKRLITEEERAEVRRALDALDEKDRRLLRLLYFDQADPEDAARQLGVSAGALRVRKHRALARLSEALGTARKRSLDFGNS
jgi:RNA polymerase sigma-70 factor, ECF subfamily